MALIKPFRHEGAADEVLDLARRHYESALKALDRLTRKLDGDEDISKADVQQAARDFRAATQTLFDERSRVEKQRKSEAGIARDYGLDLDAARAEVRGLLDRLRTT